MCSLSLAGKMEIARDTIGEMLNKRSELMHKCLHKQKFKLANLCVDLHVVGVQNVHMLWVYNKILLTMILSLITFGCC